MIDRQAVIQSVSQADGQTDGQPSKTNKCQHKLNKILSYLQKPQNPAINRKTKTTLSNHEMAHKNTLLCPAQALVPCYAIMACTLMAHGIMLCASQLGINTVDDKIGRHAVECDDMAWIQDGKKKGQGRY